MPEQDTRHEELEARIDELEEIVENQVESFPTMLNARCGGLQDQVDDTDARVDELEAQVEALTETVETLTQKLSGLAGLQDEEQTTAKKRREDLVLALQRKAEGNDGRAQMTYRDVLDQWRILNHGDLDPKQAYRAMEKLGRIDGITETENGDGATVVRINLASFDASTANGVIDNVNNASGSAPGENAVTHSD